MNMNKEAKTFKRVISISAAAVCMLSALRAVPAGDNEAFAADVMTPFEITEAMQLGWNLGNTLDAYKSTPAEGIYESYGLESETCWGNPKTTQALIDTVKAKGFNTIRVPVTWFQHVDKNNNYKIDDAWMARVKEVVDYCYNNDMYVILNLHHEEPYQNRSTLGADYEEISGYVTSLWSQIAAVFADYDQHLIFETMNEPRAEGTDHEWWGPTQEEVDTINKINADALKVIRAAKGGQNETRLVMMPGYCASSDTTMMSKVVLPEDDFVAVSVHAYTPYKFTMAEKDDSGNTVDHSTFTEGYKNELINVMDGIRSTFSDKDIPVILGEFSSSNFGNTDARVEWAETYISTTKAYGIPCVLWDNNVEKNNGGEAHGYVKRSDNTWYADSEPVVDKMVEVINDPSIKWGSARKSPVIEHDDITTGVQLIDKSYDLDAAIKDGNCTPGLNASWTLLEGGDVAVKYTGDTPVIAVCDGAWDNWTEIKPYDDKDGIAYYSSAHIASAWQGDASEIEHLFVRTNSKTTVEAIAVIGGGEVVDPPEDDVKKYDLDLSTRGDSSQVLYVTFEGAAGSAIQGCIGYMGEEWTNIEFDDKIDENGKFTVMINLPGKGAGSGNSIPAGITSAQAQIWWCDDPDAAMTNYQILGLGLPDPTEETEPTEETDPTEATEPLNIRYGDANDDDKVDISDVVAVMCYAASPEDAPLSETGLINADVEQVGNGVNASDGVSIQKFLVKLIVSLPETV